MKEGRSQVNIRDLGVFDVSENGVGILVGKKLFNWLARLEIGARLNGVELSAPCAIVKAEGVVRHKSKLHTGKYSGYHLVGIELDEKLEHYVSDRSVAGTAKGKMALG
jgi:hypothetical protein